MNRVLNFIGSTLFASAIVALPSVASADGRETSDTAAAEHTEQQTGEIKLGTSGSTSRLLSNADGVATYCYAGTLGFLVEDAEDPGGGKKTYILSNSHVLAPPDVDLGEPIIHAGLADAVCDAASAVEVGFLSDSEPISICTPKGRRGFVFDCADNRVDAAIAELSNPSEISTTGDILDIGTPGTSVIAPFPGQLVQKSGRTTGFTRGTIGAVDVTLTAVCYRAPDETCSLANSARFVNQIKIGPEFKFSAEGDSGSGIFECTDDQNFGCDQLNPPNAVGLLFAGDEDGNTYANTISDVYSALGIGTFGCGNNCDSGTTGGGGKGGGQGGGRGGKPNNAIATSLAPGLQIASDIRDFHEAELHSLPGVVGTGISVDEDGNPVIEVYLKQLATSVDNPIPSDVDGIPVRTVVTGIIRAF
ncbi:MAG: hypothetical protein ACTSVG_00640 [Alphaproteobacteria bacterium]